MANTVYRKAGAKRAGKESRPTAQAIAVDSCITRGIRLTAERADEFERVGPWTWIVPGEGRDSYTVDLRHSYCTCPDFQIRRSKLNRKPEPCKHIFACEIVSAKRKMARQRERVA
jgi:predicted nucleic acid-binding Zn finger protein